MYTQSGLALLILTSLAILISATHPPTVHLSYASYTGFHNETSGLDVFLGIRYAASTEGQNRWRTAQPPMDVRDQGYLNATSYPPQCPQGIAGVIVFSIIYIGQTICAVKQLVTDLGMYFLGRCERDSIFPFAIDRFRGLSLSRCLRSSKCNGSTCLGMDTWRRMGCEILALKTLCRVEPYSIIRSESLIPLQ